MPGAPNFSASDPFNSTGSCFAADVYKAGFLQQVQDSLGQGSLETGGCTSQDVKVAVGDYQQLLDQRRTDDRLPPGGSS
jgi:hypothetical protein